MDAAGAFTYDLHHNEEMNRGNIMTEYEEKFSAAGKSHQQTDRREKVRNVSCLRLKTHISRSSAYTDPYTERRFPGAVDGNGW